MFFDLTAGGGAGGRGAQRGGMGRGRGRGGRDMSLISQTVRISQGPYKGKLQCKNRKYDILVRVSSSIIELQLRIHIFHLCLGLIEIVVWLL